MDDAARQEERLLTARMSIERAFGGRSLHGIDPEDAVLPVGRIPSGCVSLDWALGTGGFPRSQILEIFGPESSGKTTVGLHAIAAAQRNGGIAAFVDVEHSLDLPYASALGVETNGLLYSRPAEAEEALEIVVALIRTCVVDVIVVDSFAALSPRSGFGPGGYSPTPEVNPWRIAGWLRKLSILTPRSPTCLIFLNQVRMRYTPESGYYESSAGGPFLKCYATFRARTHQIQPIRESGETVGSRSGFQVMRNRVGPSGRSIQFDILFGQGISGEADLLDLGERAGLVTRVESGYTCGARWLGSDRASSRKFLQGCPDMAAALTQAAVEFTGIHRAAAFLSSGHIEYSDF